ncbi:putative transcriptional regulator [Frankia sp. AiPs1]|uniref:helix-turn-helix domain-containing protein n=1 Tax=Frankia sp. AiPa1 TaxID=573492 RepID=UPI00202B9FCA|nr:helix-turn-helix transcriptional regulator [Frankia sp. AiPa1]MCL9757879.1 helix-turn-helix domain-containing protein [Frankia sp. AiPa1]
MRQRGRGRQGAATAEDELPGEVRRRRCERALSRDELAVRTGYSRQYIAQLEQSSRGIPSRPVIAAVDAALEAGGALIDLREAAVAARAERLRRGPDPEAESRRRVSDLLDHRRSDGELDYLDRLVVDLIAKADRLDPADVTALVLDHQNVVDNLLDTPLLPHQQFRLFMLAGHLAGLLAISLLDVDELAGASTCCLEAAVFTELTGHEGLRAWTLAVNGLIDAAARKACSDATTRAESGSPGSLTSLDEAGLEGAGRALAPGAERASADLQAGRPADPGGEAPADSLAEMLTAPGGRERQHRLIGLVKGRIDRFGAADRRPLSRQTGLSHAFRPPV